MPPVRVFAKVGMHGVAGPFFHVARLPERLKGLASGRTGHEPEFLAFVTSNIVLINKSFFYNILNSVK